MNYRHTPHTHTCACQWANTVQKVQVTGERSRLLLDITTTAGSINRCGYHTCLGARKHAVPTKTPGRFFLLMKTREGALHNVWILKRTLISFTWRPLDASLTSCILCCAVSGSTQRHKQGHVISGTQLTWLWLTSWLLPSSIFLVPEMFIKANNLSKVIASALSKGLQNQFLKQWAEGLSPCCLCASQRRWGSLPILQPSVNLTELFSWTNWLNYFLHRCCCGLSLVCLFSLFLFFTPSL